MDGKPSRRNTKQRKVILEELQKTDSHPTAAALYERVRARLPNVSLGTVYRNLDLLVRAGLIQKLNTGRGEARFDGIVEHHYHICCVHCGRVEDVMDSPIEINRSDGGELQGYHVIGHQLQFIGICPDCKGKKLH